MVSTKRPSYGMSLVSRDGVSTAVRAIRDDVLEHVQEKAVTRDELMMLGKACHDAVLDEVRAELPSLVAAAVARDMAAIHALLADLRKQLEIVQENLDGIYQSVTLDTRAQVDAVRQEQQRAMSALVEVIRAIPLPQVHVPESVIQPHFDLPTFTAQVNAQVSVSPELKATLTMPRRKTTSQRSILYDERSGLPATIVEQKTEHDE